MMHPTVDIKTFFKPGTRVHLAGIGGVSMCPLAEVLAGMGLQVQGSDMNESDTVRQLRAQGIPVAVGHSAENLKDCALVIRTAAIHDDNPEIAGAIARGIPVYERAQAWGAIMQHYQNAVCISGTHGKTTTTSMATHIFMAAQADPTVMIGGTLPLLHSGYRVGRGDTIILESCEYCTSSPRWRSSSTWRRITSTSSRIWRTLSTRSTPSPTSCRSAAISSPTRTTPARARL